MDAVCYDVMRRGVSGNVTWAGATYSWGLGQQNLRGERMKT